jgi:hypothetical protein
MTVGPGGHAAPDSVCLEQPDREAPFGEHWYYHFDRGKNRKCWHRGAAAVLRNFPFPAPLRTERTRSFSSSLNSVWSQTTRNVRNFFRQPMFHERVAGEPRIVQSDANRTLTIEDIAQRPELFPEERADPRLTSSLTLVQQRALFVEFLKWSETQQHATGVSGGATPVRLP